MLLLAAARAFRLCTRRAWIALAFALSVLLGVAPPAPIGRATALARQPIVAGSSGLEGSGPLGGNAALAGNLAGHP